MASEHLVIQSIVGSIAVDWTKPGKAARSGEAEGDRIYDLLESLCALNPDEQIFVGGCEHRIVPLATVGGTRWVETLTGGCKGQIVLAPVDHPDDRVNMRFNLAKDRDGRSGRLTLTFNPAAMLVGADIHPTIVDAVTGEMIASPSSAIEVMEQMHNLGFVFLDNLYRLLSKKKGPLFAKDTWVAIKRGDIRIARAQWDAHLMTRDRDRFLQLMTIIFAQPIASGKGAIKLATHLGLAFSAKTDAETHEVICVTLKKLQGRTPLYSVTFSSKDLRVGEMSQNEVVPAVETAAVPKNVRLEIIAYPEGIKAIISKAQERLESLMKRDSEFFGLMAEDFLTLAPESTAKQVESAISALSYKPNEEGFIRTSFADWLIPQMLHEVLRLDVITGFTRENLDKLAALDDNVARAWQAAKYSADSNWADEIAKKAGCNAQTVRNRQKEWLGEFNIDIALPYGFYRDLIFFAPASLTTPENRSALMAAISHGDAEKALALLAGAAKDFDRQRLRVVGSAIKAPVGEIAVETVVGDITTAAIQARTAALSARAKKPTPRVAAKKAASPKRAKKSTGKISVKKAKRPVRVGTVKEKPPMPYRVEPPKPPSAAKKAASPKQAKKSTGKISVKKAKRPVRVGTVKET